MIKSESIKEIAAALAKAQAKIKPAIFDATNPHFKSKYATLASVQDACRIPLSENGLSVIQTFENGEDGIYLETTLLHSSGEWISSKVKLILDKSNMQGFGSASTYARRFGLAALVGVVADSDDDGNEARKDEQNNVSKPALVEEFKAALGAQDASLCPQCGAEGRPSKFNKGELYCSNYKSDKTGCNAKWSA